MHSPKPEQRATLAFVGGTGPEGRGLATRFAALGHPVVIGSRSLERGQEVAADLTTKVPGSTISGEANLDAAGLADMVFLTIPYSGLAATVPPLADALRAKIVVSTIAPIEFREGRPVLLEVAAGSAAQEVQNLLPESRVVSAFQVIDAHQLEQVGTQMDTDVVVCSDDTEARRAIVALAGEIPGVRALSGGRLAASVFVEACTGLLITINRIYKVHSGIRLTGLKR